MTRPLWVLVAIVLAGSTAASAGGARTVAMFTLSPTITSVSPSMASAGATVKVTGSGLAETSDVVFAGNASAAIVSKAAQEVHVVVPRTARNGKLTLTTPGGTASSQISFRVLPRVSGVTADSHTVGSVVTINGSGLADVTSVYINSAQASFHVVSANEIRATIPSNASAFGSIRVYAPGGLAEAGLFAVRPTISGFSPASATAGTKIKIRGTGFWNPRVLFPGGSTGVITDSSHTAIKVVVPIGTLSGSITVATQSGEARSEGQFIVKPKLTSSTIVTSAGATVKILGSGLRDTSSVVFPGNAPAAIVSKAAQEVDVVVPATARNGSLKVTTPGGTSSVTCRVVPKVSGVSADTHTVGSVVTINGTGLADVTSVDINSAEAHFHVVSPNEIRATIPTNASAVGSIRVYGPGGLAEGGLFAVRPTISGFSPASAAAGTTIRISGSGFSNPRVQFPGGSTGVITDSSHTAINVIVPNNSNASSGSITVTTQGGTARSDSSFTFIVSPDFSLSVASASQTVKRGGQTTYRLTITPSNGFNGPVKLSLSASRLGITKQGLSLVASGTTFSPNPVAAGGTSSTLTVAVDPTTARGTYTLTITGTSGSRSHTVQVSISVQ